MIYTVPPSGHARVENCIVLRIQNGLQYSRPCAALHTSGIHSKGACNAVYINPQRHQLVLWSIRALPWQRSRVLMQVLVPCLAYKAAVDCRTRGGGAADAATRATSDRLRACVARSTPRGWLLKRGQRRKTWKRRWHVLDSTFTCDHLGGGLCQKGL